jgi:hypothetical protein
MNKEPGHKPGFLFEIKLSPVHRRVFYCLNLIYGV